ncbi:MAG: hypothetical protein ACRCW9_03925 [Cetobacterium sp.]
MYDEHRVYCDLLGVKTLIELKTLGLGHIHGWIKTDDILVRVDKIQRLKKSLTVSYKTYIMPIPSNQHTQEIDLSWLYKFRHSGAFLKEIKKIYPDLSYEKFDNLWLSGRQLNLIRRFLKSTKFLYSIEGEYIAIYDTIGIKIIIKGECENGQGETIRRQENKKT